MCTMKEKGKTFLSILIKTMFSCSTESVPARIDTTVFQNVECLVLI